MNTEIMSQASNLMIEIEELEAKIAPGSDVAFLDRVTVAR